MRFVAEFDSQTLHLSNSSINYYYIIVVERSFLRRGTNILNVRTSGTPDGNPRIEDPGSNPGSTIKHMIEAAVKPKLLYESGTETIVEPPTGGWDPTMGGWDPMVGGHAWDLKKENQVARVTLSKNGKTYLPRTVDAWGTQADDLATLALSKLAYEDIRDIWDEIREYKIPWVPTGDGLTAYGWTARIEIIDKGDDLKIRKQ